MTTASNLNYQLASVEEAVKTISKDTGIAFEILINQLRTDINLMNRVAKMVALAEEKLYKSINEI